MTMKLTYRIIGGIACILLLIINSGQKSAAQQMSPVMNWEDANMLAVRENKLVLVAAGVQPDKKLFSNPDIKHFLGRTSVAIYMDMQSEAGKRFEPKLLLTPFPVYAFFMPFGDLLITADAREVARNPQVLADAAKQAQEIARIKQNNSRSIQFVKSLSDEQFRAAQEEGKTIFMYFRRSDCRKCLWMEKNVFNLDKVADFYNRYFIPCEIDDTTGGWAEQYGIKNFPAYLFVNPEKKVIYKTEGEWSADRFLEEGEKALEKAKGITFINIPWPEVLEKARLEGKLIFVDVYGQLGKERRALGNTVYRDPGVADFFNRHFVNVDYDLTKTDEKSFSSDFSFAMYFLDNAGNMLHQVVELPDTTGLVEEARRAMEGRGLTAVAAKYRDGYRDKEFIETYIQLLARAGKPDEAARITKDYLEEFSWEKLKEMKYWKLFRAHFKAADSGLFADFYIHRTEFYPLFGEKEVDDKVREVWEAGAESYIREQEGKFVFDEKGFKEYGKRLKKEKVENRNYILRKARMNAAEKVGDWRVFSELAEERWNEERVPETELYAWGVKINEHCQDKSIRYKAARWFAIAAYQIEEKEKREGKIRISSYKGFFEKLVNDLLKE
jgi:hypothetical protein